MRKFQRPFILICCCVCGLALLIAGCQRPRGGRNYVVRAQVVQTPDAASAHTLFLHHEALRAGDKVEVILHLDWKSDRPVEITGLRKLAPGLKLDFRAARPPARP